MCGISVVSCRFSVLGSQFSVERVQWEELAMENVFNLKLDMKSALEGVTNRKPKTDSRQLLSHAAYRP